MNFIDLDRAAIDKIKKQVMTVKQSGDIGNAVQISLKFSRCIHSLGRKLGV